MLSRLVKKYMGRSWGTHIKCLLHKITFVRFVYHQINIFTGHPIQLVVCLKIILIRFFKPILVLFLFC